VRSRQFGDPILADCRACRSPLQMGAKTSTKLAKNLTKGVDDSSECCYDINVVIGG